MKALRKLLKIILWTTLTLLLLGGATVLATICVLRPERLTPLVEQLSNKSLNANVSVQKVELSIRKSWPFLELQVDSLVIVSRDMATLPAAARDTLPAWADTLASFGQLKGGINVLKLPLGQISLNDLEVWRPQVNLFIASDSLSNFNIAKPSADDQPDNATIDVPDIRIRSFSILQPREIRYADAVSGTYVGVMLDTVSLVNETGKQPQFVPAYQATLTTNIVSPMLQEFGIRDIPVGFDGTVEWQHDHPFQLALEDFKFMLSELSGIVCTQMDFSDQLCIKSLNLDINPLSISRTLDIIPDSIKQTHHIPVGVETDATLTLKAKLKSPFVAGVDTIPHASIEIDMPESSLKWQKVDLRQMALNIVIDLNGNNLNNVNVAINELMIAGPATTIDMHGRLSSVIDDPLFDGCIHGHINLALLPPVLTAWLDGATAKGKIDIHTDIIGRPSMFSRDHFHQLQVSGTVSTQDLYYLAADTLTMFYAHKGNFKFGTNESTTVEGRKGTHKMDSLLTARIDIDSTQILVSGLKIGVNDFRIGVGAQNRNNKSDTTAIIPMGGNLHVGNFALFTLSDTSGVRIRDLDGSVSMHRYKGDAHLPFFNLKAGLGRVSAGNNNARFFIANASLQTRINKLSDDQLPKGRREVKHLSDSIRKVHPQLPIDSVYKLALEIRQRYSTHRHRVRAEMDSINNEIIEWGTSDGLRKFLLDWNLTGSLSADHARMFTTSFPLRNRLKNLNIKFNNDSVSLTNVAYKAGHSDFLVSGNITNIKRAFTSKRPSPIKVNFDVLSDTIDVNQLAQAFFTGAANKDTKIDDTLDEDKLDHEIDRETHPDSVGPFLIPVNIDAQLHLKANNVLYSDFILHGMQGTVLAYDGALNLHNLRASSDVGSINLSALYSAPNPNDMKFGFGLGLKQFNIKHFLNMVPAIDSIMPMMRDFGGIINAQIAATSDVSQNMDLELPTLNAVINLQGDSLVVLDEKTYKTIAKWLLFKDKNNNMIDHMSVDVVVKDNMLHIYPFMFDFDRYRLGVQGSNDLEMNFNYHVAVLKSPIPFKFGINISGNADKYKIRLGRAHFNEKESVNSVTLADTTSVNLISQFENIFRRGVRNSEFATVHINARPNAANIDLQTDTLTSADSLYFKQQGLIP